MCDMIIGLSYSLIMSFIDKIYDSYSLSSPEPLPYKHILSESYYSSFIDIPIFSILSRKSGVFKLYTLFIS